MNLLRQFCIDQRKRRAFACMHPLGAFRAQKLLHHSNILLALA